MTTIIGAKVYTRHRCDRHHRLESAFLRCAYPRLHWVLGTGRYAVMAWCGGLTVTLWENLADAKGSMAWIDSTGCGHACDGRHEIVKIGLAGQKRGEDWP
ncbi:hypothetical protein SBI67_17875 [Mycolicibacterium sp. 120266]|uniref:hypothetical protein n=1 Tax=Mycolicibacterium sp. 120266 TaxID=3090601 RepID=UPI00299D916B|nr:hypothetical protein [Mycolicibacterium sp. 120266]MDX1873994.1 hypothetical protein [Mycolicibacterium sp. 120266]